MSKIVLAALSKTFITWYIGAWVLVLWTGFTCLMSFFPYVWKYGGATAQLIVSSNLSSLKVKMKMLLPGKEKCSMMDRYKEAKKRIEEM